MIRKVIRCGEKERNKIEDAMKKLFFSSYSDFFRFALRVAIILERKEFRKFVLSIENGEKKTEVISFYVNRREDRILKMFSTFFNVSESELIRLIFLYISLKTQKTPASNRS